jgi:hypothetical protein
VRDLSLPLRSELLRHAKMMTPILAVASVTPLIVVSNKSTFLYQLIRRCLQDGTNLYPLCCRAEPLVLALATLVLATTMILMNAVAEATPASSSEIVSDNWITMACSAWIATVQIFMSTPMELSIPPCQLPSLVSVRTSCLHWMLWISWLTKMLSTLDRD